MWADLGKAILLQTYSSVWGCGEVQSGAGRVWRETATLRLRLALASVVETTVQYSDRSPSLHTCGDDMCPQCQSSALVSTQCSLEWSVFFSAFGMNTMS